MAFTIKNFRLNVTGRVILISLITFLLAFIITTTQWLFTPLFIFLLLAISVLNLIKYVEKTNKELTQFLYNIKQGGFTTLIKSGSSGKNELGLIFNEVIEEFKKVSIEKESHYQYLKTLNEQIGVSIISYNENGKITLMNPAAKALLKKPYMKMIDELESIDTGLWKLIKSMRSGQREVIKCYLGKSMIQLVVQMKKFVLHEETFKVLLLQNINSELEQQEVEAWQKLISVLTHEIMNSVTPITSLSTAVNQQLHSINQWEKIKEEDREDILMSLQTVENRSKGLMKFVNAYKEFSKTPEVNLSEANLVELIDRICKLLEPDLQRANIQLIKDYNIKKLILRIDHELIEQVFINLIKNAIEALTGKEDGFITIAIKHSVTGKVLVKVEDNGTGMEKEVMDKIFIPFYTTRKNGTGIGLSFTRQVMKLHGGSIEVSSKPGTGTTFFVEF